MKEAVLDFNALFANNRSFMQQILDIPYIMRQIGHDFSNGGAETICANFLVFVFLAIMVLYTLSPIDLIPEAVFGVLGLVDDGLVDVIMMLLAANQYYSQWVGNNQR